MAGQAKGMRLENFTTATTPAAGNIGRVGYNSDTKQIVVDTGLEWTAEGINRYVADVVFDGVVLAIDVTVSSKIVDARNCQVQLLNNIKDFDRIYCTLKATSQTVIHIETNTPLPAGSYRLIVIE